MFDPKLVIPKVVAEMKPSGIRKYFGIMDTLPDAISLGVGEPDFITPKHVMEAGIASLHEGKTQYTANAGLPALRKEISIYMEGRFHISYNPDNEVLVTVGGSEAIDLCLRAFLEPGDEILVPEPSFVCYAPLASLCGAKPVPIVTTKENSFKLTPEALKAAITPKTKALILSYPNNPTGAILTKEELEALTAVIRETNMIVISDEIYAELTYGRKHCSIASLPGMWERTVVVSGFSKAFAMTGWRLGYCCAPKDLMKPVLQIHQYALMCASTPAQYAGVEALQNGLGDCAHMCEEYDKRRQYLYKALLDMGFDCFEPEGAFYIFPDVTRFAKNGDEFVEALLEDQHLAVVPGSAFGECGMNHVRISYAYSMENLKKAVERIEKFVAK
ncbi:MAG: aminotransferase class I/II-fold pyridoxal phosphate-dependent enzyme, partial [Clostridia bacterium]|nr:aminotransferase class I/II-fold pyridoxal phosphate-dependent enzyme [Clostridia bacterium]